MKTYEIFNQYKKAQIQIQLLATIVQNQGVTIEEKEIQVWIKDFENTLFKLERLKEATAKHLRSGKL